MTQSELPASQEGQYVRANDLNIYYEEYGSGEPLILIHGGLLTGKVHWGKYIPDFVEHFRVIMPDSRGHGRTENPMGEFSYRLMAEDMAAFARALDLDKPLIYGYSDGGQITLEIGMRHPDLPKALAVGAAWYKFSEVYLEAMRSLLCIDESGNADPDRMERENPQLAGFVRETQQAQGPDYWKMLIKQLVPTWITPLGYTQEDFERIRAPTLVFIGDRDEFIPVEEAVEMYRMLPNAELYVAPGQDHYAGIRKPAARSTLIDFLLRHSAHAEAE